MPADRVVEIAVRFICHGASSDEAFSVGLTSSCAKAGLGVRCLGAITRDRLEALREADAIVREEIDNAGLDIWQYFCSVPDLRATGVRDGKRAYEWAAIIRCVNTVDAMTADVPELDWALLKKITSRILDEVPGICRVTYDLTPKPIGTIEWE